MARHEGDGLPQRPAPDFSRHILQNALLLIISNPVRKIMKPGRIAAQPSPPVTDLPEEPQEGRKRSFPGPYLVGQGNDVFGKSKTIKRSQIGNEMLDSLSFECSGLVRSAEEESADIEYEATWFGRRLCSLVQIPDQFSVNLFVSLVTQDLSFQDPCNFTNDTTRRVSESISPRKRPPLSPEFKFHGQELHHVLEGDDPSQATLLDDDEAA